MVMGVVGVGMIVSEGWVVEERGEEGVVMREVAIG